MLRGWIVLCFTALAASPALAVDLWQAYQLARKNDATFLGAQASYRAAQAGSNIALAGLLPTIAFNASANAGHSEIKNITTSNHDFNNNNLSLSLNQPFFRWQNWQNYDKSKINRAIAELQLSQAEQDLIVRTAQTYFDVVVAEESNRTMEAQRSALQQQLQAVERRQQIGTATLLDVVEARAAYDQAAAQQLNTASDVDTKVERLRILTQGAFDTIKKLGAVSTPLSLFPNNNVDDWLERARNANYDAAILRLNYQLAAENYSQQKGGHYPTLDLVGNITRSDGSSVGSSNKDTVLSQSIGVVLNVPLFSGGAVSSAVEQSAAQLQQSSQLLQNGQYNLEINTHQLYRNIANSESQLKALATVLQSQQQATQAIRSGYALGVRNNLDVLNAERQLASAVQNHTRARYDFLLAQLRLKAVASELRQEDVQRLNEWLE